MQRLVLHRLAGLPPMLLAVSLLVFLAVRALPGDPARLMAGPQASGAAVAAMRLRLGLDRPLPAQYLAFLTGAAHGDLGISITSRTPVIHEIAIRLPYTLRLAALSEALALCLALPLGVLAAIYRGGLLDRVLALLTALGASVANFWLALMAMDLFAVRLRWLPLLGAGSWQHYVLPTLVLSTLPTALMLRMTRSGMIEVLAQDYIRTARAKGLPSWMVHLRHGLRNMLGPIVTLLALTIGSLIGGAVITETVFDWPGLGRLLVEAVRLRDYPVIQAMTLLAVLAVVLANLLGELAVLWLDPRLRTR